MSAELTPIQNSLKGQNLIGIANNTMRELPPLSVLDEDLYAYKDNFWNPISDIELGQYIYKMFADSYPSAWTPSKTKNIIEGIKYHPKVKKIDEFDTYKGRNLMNLQNGVLDLDNIKDGLISHDQKYLSTSVIPVDYNPDNTDCPNFINFLKDTFRNPDNTIDTDMCETIIQLGGYLLYPQVRAKKLFVFYGNGSNGKSILMDNVFSLFFNQNNVTDLSLNILANEDNPARGDLLVSRINMCGEQKGGEIASDEIKKMVSGEMISVKRHYKNSRKRFRCHAKFLVSGNERIYLKDSTYGADRRLFAIDFLNKFVSKQKYALYEKEYAKVGLTPSEKRVFLATDERVLTKQFIKESQAILNLFLEGLKQLRENNWKFRKHASIVRAELEYKEESDPTTLWINQAYKESSSDSDFIPFYEIYDNYILWFNLTFQQSKKNALSKIYLSKKIKENFRIDNRVHKNKKGFNLKLL